jgi:hypothetical protein
MAPSASQLTTDSFEFGNSAAQGVEGEDNMGEGIDNGRLNGYGSNGHLNGHGSDGYFNGYEIFPLADSN